VTNKSRIIVAKWLQTEAKSCQVFNSYWHPTHKHPYTHTHTHAHTYTSLQV